MTEEANISVRNEIDKRLDVLNVTAKYFKRSDFSDRDQISERLNESVEKNNFKLMGVSLFDGTTYLNTGDTLNVSDREYFQKSAQGEESYLYYTKINYNN